MLFSVVSRGCLVLWVLECFSLEKFSSLLFFRLVQNFFPKETWWVITTKASLNVWFIPALIGIDTPKAADSVAHLALHFPSCCSCRFSLYSISLIRGFGILFRTLKWNCFWVPHIMETHHCYNADITIEFGLSPSLESGLYKDFSHRKVWLRVLDNIARSILLSTFGGLYIFFAMEIGFLVLEICYATNPCWDWFRLIIFNVWMCSYIASGIGWGCSAKRIPQVPWELY